MNENGISRRQRMTIKQVKRDTEQALEHPPTRRMLLRLIETGGFTRSSFNGDAIQTVFNEGRRSLALDIVNEIEGVSPGEFARMQAEAIALRLRQEEETAEEADDD